MNKYDYSKLTGHIVTKEDFSYEENRKAWNRAIEKYPLVIVYCKNKEDIKNSISWCIDNNVEFRIRSGCHNYEGYSTGNDVLVIDVSKMNNIDLDEENNTVTIEAGVRNRELYKTLGEKHYPFPGGGCPTVGVVGLVLGGGWGYSSRMLGLSCDSLVELELIDYKGNNIIANESVNTDLFWACRGAGGGNFGVIVSMKFRLPNKVEKATLINIDYLEISEEECLEIFSLWQDEFHTFDKRLNMKFSIYNSEEKGKGIHITGLFYGTLEEANNILNSFKNVIGKVNYHSEYIAVSEANKSIQDSHPDYERYKSTGRFVYTNYSREEMKNIIKLIETRAEGAYYAAISLYGLGGEVLNMKKDDTAFYYRDAKAIMGIQSVWNEPKYAIENKKWVLEKFEYIKSITKGSFINFPLAELENYEEEYYGDNINKLREIKKKYDVENIFKFPQGIK